MHKKTQDYKRVHPFTIYTYLYKFIFLLIIPLVQNLLFKPRGLAEIIATMGFNILFVGVIIFFAVMEYKQIRFRCGKSDFFFKRGLFVERKFKIPYSVMQSVIIQKNIFPGIFGAVRIHIDTPASLPNKSDVTVWMSRKRAAETERSIYSLEKITAIYKSAPYHILVMAATWSNSFTGLLIFAPFVSKVGKILGEQYSQKLYETVNLSTYLVAIGIPPATAYFAGILVIGFVVAVVVQIFRYGNFKITKRQSYFEIERGIITNTKNLIVTAKINAYEIKQSLLMIFFKLHSVYIHTIGSGKAKGDRSLLIPAQNKDKTKKILSTFTSIPLKYTKQVKCHKNKLLAYLYLPIFTGVCIIIGGAFLTYISFNKDILLICMALAVPLNIIWIIFRCIAHSKAAIAYNDKAVIINSYKKLNLTTALIPFEKLQYIVIRQSLFQQISGSCNVKAFIYSEHRESFTIKHLSLIAAQEIIDEIHTVTKHTIEVS